MEENVQSLFTEEEWNVLIGNCETRDARSQT